MSHTPSPPPASTPAADVARRTAYLLTGLPIATAAFALIVTGLSLAAGLLVTVVGFPVAAATLALATTFGRLERARLAAAGHPLPPLVLARPAGSGLRRAFSWLAEPQRWLAVLHALGGFVLTVITWSITVTWWAVAAGGLTYWLWQGWLPEDDDAGNTSLVELLHLSMSESLAYFILGVVFAATLPVVLRGLMSAHVGWGRLLLAGESRRALEQRVTGLEASRSAAVAAEAQSLRRLERDLHDGPQQRLLRLGMDLASAERRLDDDPEQAREILAQARTQTAEALAELRQLSRGIAPPILADRGLEAALSSVVARSTVPTGLVVDLEGRRPPAAAESAAYYVVCEALTNVAKHAGASRAAVRIGYRWEGLGTADEAAWLTAEVEDDGVGGAAVAKGHGLAGLADRVAGLGGRLEVLSPEGGPTVVTAALPWAWDAAGAD